jgi:hypothetical protein
MNTTQALEIAKRETGSPLEALVYAAALKMLPSWISGTLGPLAAGL